MNNDEPQDRRTLIELLRARDVPAYEYHSGGGIFHVVADLLDDPASGDLLQIATGSGASDCDLGLMGWKDGGSWEARDWDSVTTMEDAASRFVSMWEGRDQLIESFKADRLETW